MDPLGKAWVYDPVINRTFLVSDPGRNAEFLSPQFSVACNIFAQWVFRLLLDCFAVLLDVCGDASRARLLQAVAF